MKFYDRRKEIKRIRNLYDKTSNHSSIIVLTGRRRIGKTRLVLESFKEKNFLYFFVGKKKIPQLLQEWTDEINSKLEPLHAEFTSFTKFVEYLFHKSKEKTLTIFFDEVQNFLSIYPAAFSDLQKHFDLHRESSSLLLIFAGSSYSMVEKIFTGSKEPLFGRASEFMELSYLPISTQKEILEDHNLYSGENLLHTFSIFDGIPRFYEELVEIETGSFKKRLKKMIVEKEFIWDEGLNMMREEFGKDYSIYHSILSSIALGKRSRNEIEQAIGGAAGGYLQNLENIYRLIKREKPLFAKSPKSAVQRYYFKDNFFEFWFRFISRYQSLREIERKDKAFEKIWQALPEYEGTKLEKMIRRIFIEANPFDLDFTMIGRYWDRKGENEIDLILLDEDAGKAFLVEVKRNLAKALKKEEKIKFYNKVSQVTQLENFEKHYLYAGIDGTDIFIVDEKEKVFKLA